jgi:hypothetical protein
MNDRDRFRCDETVKLFNELYRLIYVHELSEEYLDALVRELEQLELLTQLKLNQLRCKSELKG